MTRARTLFGTDGVRGRAGEKLTEELAIALGRGAGSLARGPRPRALIVRDTRESGPLLESGLARGLAQAGVDVELGGVAPTPAAAIAVGRDGIELAAVISASHNPWTDNGIKFFGPDGYKLTDEREAEIESRLGIELNVGRMGAITRSPNAIRGYYEALLERYGTLNLRGRRVLLDCANGAAYETAPAIFRALGADVTVIGDRPDGRNINAGCGSTHPEALQSALDGHDIGFAFDGDADRLLACDRHGRLLDGDDLLVLAATHLKDGGRLRGNGVAVTAMSNFGVRAVLAAEGIELCETAVGDRYLLAALREHDWSLGAEPSGHLIDRNFAPSGDGISAALLILEALAGRDLADVATFDKLPQGLRNVTVAGAARDAAARPGVRDAVRDAQAALAGRGRVLVRPSGTEPLVRVMTEAPSAGEAEAICGRLAAAVVACA
jgi:phosphoglucosamine mutase